MFCEEEYFRQLIDQYKLNLEYCVAFTTEKIHILKEVEKYNPQNDIMKIVIHEYVHFLQCYATGLSKTEYLWLYESIACYMAQQKRNVDCLPRTSWNTFKNNFYECPNNYDWAYRIGEYLFDHYDDGEIVEFCKESLKLKKIEEEVKRLFFEES